MKIIAVFTLLLLTGCLPSKDREITDSNIIFRDGNITVRKLIIDTTTYIVVDHYRGGVAIIKHN